MASEGQQCAASGVQQRRIASTRVAHTHRTPPLCLSASAAQRPHRTAASPIRRIAMSKAPQSKKAKTNGGKPQQVREADAQRG